MRTPRGSCGNRKALLKRGPGRVNHPKGKTRGARGPKTPLFLAPQAVFFLGKMGKFHISSFLGPFGNPNCPGEVVFNWRRLGKKRAKFPGPKGFPPRRLGLNRLKPPGPREPAKFLGCPPPKPLPKSKIQPIGPKEIKGKGKAPPIKPWPPRGFLTTGPWFPGVKFPEKGLKIKGEKVF